MQTSYAGVDRIYALVVQGFSCIGRGTWHTFFSSFVHVAATTEKAAFKIAVLMSESRAPKYDKGSLIRQF